MFLSEFNIIVVRSVSTLSVITSFFFSVSPVLALLFKDGLSEDTSFLPLPLQNVKAFGLGHSSVMAVT